MLTLWKESYDQPRQHIQKQRIYFATKIHLVKAMVFSSSHVWVWELDCEESWVLKNCWFWTAVLENSWESLRLQGYPTISSSVIPFSSCPQSFPASGSFQMSQLFAWGGQSIGVPASASVLPMNTQDWSPLEWTWVSLQSKEFSRVFSNTTVQKHQFFGAQLFL